MHVPGLPAHATSPRMEPIDVLGVPVPAFLYYTRPISAFFVVIVRGLSAHD